MNSFICSSFSAAGMVQNGMISSVCAFFVAAVWKVANETSSSVCSANDVVVEFNLLSIIPKKNKSVHAFIV